MEDISNISAAIIIPPDFSSLHTPQDYDTEFREQQQLFVQETQKINKLNSIKKKVVGNPDQVELSDRTAAISELNDMINRISVNRKTILDSMKKLQAGHFEDSDDEYGGYDGDSIISNTIDDVDDENFCQDCVVQVWFMSGL